MGPQRRDVETTVAVHVDHLLDGRWHQERAVAALGLDDATQLFGVAARGEDVGAAHHERREREHQRRDVEHRSGVEVRVLERDVGEGRHHVPLEEARGVREQRSVGTTTERRGVDHQDRR